MITHLPKENEILILISKLLKHELKEQIPLQTYHSYLEK